MLGYLCLGFIVGLRHALEADHVAAVVSLATRGGSLGRQAAQGALWGLGHTLTLLLVGGGCISLGLAIPQSWERSFEALVGVMLVVLGASVFLRLRRQEIHFHGHRHADGTFHAHAHRHEDPANAARHEHPHGLARVPLQALVVGSVHGLAGSAALVLVVAQGARSTATGLLYIALFGLGSILGMMGLAASIGLPLSMSRTRLSRLYLVLSGTAGTFSVLLGAKMLWTFASGS